jgi:hypothetical protein
MRHSFYIIAAILAVSLCLASQAQQPATTDASDSAAGSNAAAALPSAPLPPTDAQPGEINGTVTDVNGDLIPGATVALDGPSPSDHQTQAANDSGFFQFTGLTPGVPYHVTISAKGFENWVSPPITLAAGQFFGVTDIKLKLESSVSSVTVYASTEQIAAHQVEIAEQQRIVGFIPNFYVVYDSKNAVPLTTKLKFQMAYKVSIDPVSIAGAFAMGAMNQAGNTPNYPQGWKGYGQRVGAAYADGVTDIMFGGAILPSLLHQDPRYFYQGTGTTKSRLMNAMSYPFVCRGDNGKRQINFSSLGGDLISSSLSNLYYPASNRGAGLVFQGFAIGTGTRVLSTVLQEFVLRKLTPSAKEK